MKTNLIRSYIVLSIPVILCLLPSGIESNVILPTGNKQGLPLFDLLALSLIFVYHYRWNIEEIRTFFLYSLILIFSTLVFQDNILARLLASIQFFIGYFLAKSYVINDSSKLLLKKLCFLLIIFTFAQQVIFSLGLLGMVPVDVDASASLGDGIFRVGTTIGTSNDTSHLMVILVSIYLYLSKDIRYKTVMILLLFASAIISGCRGAQLMAVFPFLYYLYEIRHKGGLISLIIVGVVLFYLADRLHVYDLITAREASVMAYGDVSSGRFDRWVDAFRAINQSFFTQIFGNGALTIPHGMNYSYAKTIASPHNCYIGIIVETGYFGLCCIILFLINKLKRIQRINYATLGLASVFFVSFNTEVYGLVLLPSFFYWLLYFLSINDNQTRITTNIKKQ